MADTLTQLIAKIQPQLLDNGTLFTTPTLTAAVRQALNYINTKCPENQATTTTAVANQKEYELTALDTRALKIIDVVLEGTNEYDISLDFDQYVEDSRVWFRLRQAQPASKTLIIKYTIPYTINGLDSATDSTLTDKLNTLALDGACYYAIMTRIAYAVEANNINPDVARLWMQSAQAWRDIFETGLSVLQDQSVSVSEPDLRTWEDKYHNWNM